MIPLLISACLTGAPVRYDGRGKPLDDSLMARLSARCRLVPLCPELSGGLPVPRPPAEIENAMSGDDVLDGRARVLEKGGRDVTALFVAGAENALEVAVEQGCRFALLIDGSPSCGSLAIYDGAFSGTKHPGNGVTAALLARNGIEVFTPARSDALLHRLEEIS
jgi:uncharacterized protein YbbK (DUF523 family)